MNTSQKSNRDWRIGFRKNVPKLIWTGIIIALAGAIFGLIVMNIFSPEELADTGRAPTPASPTLGPASFGFRMFALSRFVLYGGLGLVIFGIFMYAITRTVEPSE